MKTDRQDGGLLHLVYGAAVLLALLLLLVWLVSVPGYYRAAVGQTLQPYVLGERVVASNETLGHDAAQRGLSVPTYALYRIALNGYLVLAYYLAGGVILWRARVQAFGRFTAVALMLLGTTEMAVSVVGSGMFASLLPLFYLPGYLAWPLWVLWLYLFPNGRVAPRWAVYPMGALFAAFFGLQVASLLAVLGIIPPTIDTVAAQFGVFMVLPIFGAILVSQLYRYRRVYTLAERQQAKWLLWGIGAFALVLLVWSILRGVLPGGYTQDVFSALFLVFPVAVGIAITRYRLFDIDVIIRRTLVYSVVTALLALVYFGGVILLQNVFQGLTGQTSPLAVVASTLAIAALFTPLRRRVQNAVDRRFYRRRYNAEQVLASFGATVRDEVELERLTEQLLGAVEDTLQPAHASLWLRDVDPRAR